MRGKRRSWEQVFSRESHGKSEGTSSNIAAITACLAHEKMPVEKPPDGLVPQHALEKAYYANGKVGHAIELPFHVVAVLITLLALVTEEAHEKTLPSSNQTQASS
jgi:hypothetical protein